MPGDRSARLRAGSQLPDSGHRLPAALSPRSGLGAALLAVVVVVLGTWVARAVTRRGPARHPVTAPSGAPVPRADQPADSAPKDNDNDDDDEHTTTPARATAPAGAAGDPRPRVRGRAHAAVA